MITNETRIIDLTVAELQNIIGKTVKNNLPIQQTSEQNLPDLGGIALAEEITGWAKATIYTKVHFRTIPFIKKEGTKKLFFSRKELLDWLRSGKKKTKAEIAQEATDFVAFKNM